MVEGWANMGAVGWIGCIMGCGIGCVGTGAAYDGIAYGD
jgi:hypothetical protein